MNAMDRVKFGFLKLLDGVVRRMDYFALYPCKVVSQGADDTLELQPDDAKIPGLSKVPIRHGLPGVKVKVSSGARILLGFENGDPRQPFAALWTMNGADLVSMEIGNGPSKHLALAEDVTSQLNSLKSAINGWTPMPNDGGAALKAALTGLFSTWPGGIASSTVKST